MNKKLADWLKSKPPKWIDTMHCSIIFGSWIMMAALALTTSSKIADGLDSKAEAFFMGAGWLGIFFQVAAIATFARFGDPADNTIKDHLVGFCVFTVPALAALGCLFAGMAL